MFDQKWDVFATLAQRRYGNGKNIQPIPKVFAKQSLLDVVVEISISGRNNSHINFDRARTAQAFEFALLNDAEQLHLYVSRQLANFIQKKCCAMRQFKAANLASISSSERAPFMPKQFALDQAGRQRGAIDFYQRPIAALAGVVNCTRHQ